MSVHPIEIATEIPREPVQRKPRSYCSKEFFFTVVSLFVSVPILVWVFTILYRMVAQSAQEPPLCDRLLKVDHTGEAIAAMVSIVTLILIYALIALPLRDWYATVALLLVFSASISVVSGFPNVNDENKFGLFRTRSPTKTLNGGNNSEYWMKNIESCVCKTEACEDYVYRNYLVNLYRLDAREGFGFSGYKRLSPDEEAKRIEPPAQDLNGTSLKNGDRSRPISDSRYHEVCYSESEGDEGKKTLCYSCYACEEKRLRHKERSRWKIGNQLFVESLLLIASNLIVFLAESWARYVD